MVKDSWLSHNLGSLSSYYQKGLVFKSKELILIHFEKLKTFW